MKFALSTLLLLLTLNQQTFARDPFMISLQKGDLVGALTTDGQMLVGEIRSAEATEGTREVVFFEADGKTLDQPQIDRVPEQVLVPSVPCMSDICVGNLAVSSVPREDGRNLTARVEVLRIFVNGLVLLQPQAADGVSAENEKPILVPFQSIHNLEKLNEI